MFIIIIIYPLSIEVLPDDVDGANERSLFDLSESGVHRAKACAWATNQGAGLGL